MAPAEGACAPLNPAFVAQMEALLGAEAPAFWAAWRLLRPWPCG